MEGKEYRDDLAKELKESRHYYGATGRTRAQDYLDTEKETSEYKEAKEEHAEKINEVVEKSKKNKYELRQIKEHGREWFVEFSNDKEIVQKLFSLIDELNNIGIRPTGKFDSDNWAVTIIDRDGDFGFSKKTYYEEKLWTDLYKKLKDFEELFSNVQGELSERGKLLDIEGLERKYPFIYDLDHYPAGSRTPISPRPNARIEFYNAIGMSPRFGGFNNFLFDNKLFMKFADRFKKPDEIIKKGEEEHKEKVKNDKKKKLKAEIEAKQKELEELN